jgi:exodeoxyribonuclease-5
MEKEEGGFLKPKLAKKGDTKLQAPAGIASNLNAQFPFAATEGQQQLFFMMETWLNNKAKGRHVFVLRGYAGTGKTAFLGALVKVLPRIGMKVQLMAPTGRASKVISSYTGKLALTLHKRIFRMEADRDGIPRLLRQKNTSAKTLFVVDEASMLGNQAEFGIKGILEELIRFVFEDESNRLLIIGDGAQLPPVGTDLSPALKPEGLASAFGLDVLHHELTEVVRQEADSGILENATRLREVIRLDEHSFKIRSAGFADVFTMSPARLAEGIEYAYQKFGFERTLIITRTNKQANRYNKMIRSQILFREEEVEAGDWIIVVKNNYAQGEAGGFIANGELGQVARQVKTWDDYPLRLSQLEIAFPENSEEASTSCYAVLDLLYSDSPQLEEQQLRTFQDSLLQELGLEESNPKKRWQRMRTDPRANPLQLKFGYALTCHKAQGGQWDAVFIDHGFLRENEPDREFFRWLYTAFTRAKKEVFLVGPDKSLLPDS